jgi:NRPS condensation-like uncharacterized protein
MSDAGVATSRKRRITAMERLFTRSPFSIVTLVARIKGNISESMLRTAVSKLGQRHPVLMARIAEDDNHALWFTSEGAKEIPVKVLPKESKDQWIRVVQESSQVPFDFEVRPPVRFILVQSPTSSDLIILCHHIICDGLSLAYLARDLMVHLGDPEQEVVRLPEAPPIDLNNMPADVSASGIVKYFINRINKKWKKDAIYFDQKDYQDLTEAYWMRYSHQLSSIELSEAETTALVERCRKERVTVNSALTAAFVGAQAIVLAKGTANADIGVAGNLRDRLPKPAGEAMGFFAGVVILKQKYNQRTGFWENARRFHRKLTPLFTNKNLFKVPLTWCYLEPAILDSINFKKLGGLLPTHFDRYQKLSTFSERDDVVLSILKRDKTDRLDKVLMGTAVTNLTRLDFPRAYGALELDRLTMKPGGAFPLASVNLVVGAVTCAGKLSLIIEYVEDNIDLEAMQKIQKEAVAFLLDE